MTRLSVSALCGALSLYIAIAVATPLFADESVAPVRLDSDKIAGLGLASTSPDAYKDILVSGELKMRVVTLFEGKELRVEIFGRIPGVTMRRLQARSKLKSFDQRPVGSMLTGQASFETRPFPQIDASLT
jgi:hypothetical protein